MGPSLDASTSRPVWTNVPACAATRRVRTREAIRVSRTTGSGRCHLTTGSHPKLPEVVIEVLVQHHAPTATGNPAKHPARWPARLGSPISRSANQVAKATDVCLPGRWGRREKLGWTTSLPFRPGDDVDRQPVEWRMAQWAGGRRGHQLPQTVPQVAAHMTDHLWRCETPPQRLAIRRQAADPIEDGISGLGVEE